MRKLAADPIKTSFDNAVWSIHLLIDELERVSGAADTATAQKTFSLLFNALDTIQSTEPHMVDLCCGSDWGEWNKIG